MGTLDFIEKEFEQGIPITNRVRNAVVDLFEMMDLLEKRREITDSQIAHALVSTCVSSSVETDEYRYSIDGRVFTGSVTLGGETRVSTPNLWKWAELFDALREAYKNKESGRSDRE